MDDKREEPTLVIEGGRSFIRGGGVSRTNEGGVAERKIKVDYVGRQMDATVVSIVESVDRWSDVKLDDGTLLRVKLSVLSASRVDGEYDPSGNPAYVLTMTPTMVVAEAPDKLRKKT